MIAAPDGIRGSVPDERSNVSVLTSFCFRKILRILEENSLKCAFVRFLTPLPKKLELFPGTIKQYNLWSLLNNTLETSFMYIKPIY